MALKVQVGNSKCTPNISGLKLDFLTNQEKRINFSSTSPIHVCRWHYHTIKMCSQGVFDNSQNYIGSERIFSLDNIFTSGDGG